MYALVLVANALYWIDEYRFDGLRLDAVHAIVDDSRPDIVTKHMNGGIVEPVEELLGVLYGARRNAVRPGVLRHDIPHICRVTGHSEASSRRRQLAPIVRLRPVCRS